MNKKVILCSDLHAGVRGDIELFHNIFKDFFDKFLSGVIERDNLFDSTIFILGDIFDNRNTINNKTKHIVLDTFEKFIDRFPKLDINIILGNHDIYYRNSKEIHSLDFLNYLPTIDIIDKIERIKLFNRSLVMCPWLIDKEEESELFKEKADVCLGHFEINGFELIKGIIENEGMEQHNFNTNFNLTFTGHFHLNSEKDNIIYIGSPYSTKWTDCDTKKGIYILDLENLNYNFIENTLAPKYKKIFLSTIKNKEINLKQEIPGNFISLVLNDEISTKNLNKLNFLISSLNPLTFNMTDAEKRYDNIELSDYSESPITFLYDYIDLRSFEENINKEILKKKINNIYSKLSGII